MVCFIWLAELSFFKSAWSSLILKSHPDFLEPSYPSGYRGREEGTSPDSHPLTTFDHHCTTWSTTYLLAKKNDMASDLIAKYSVNLRLKSMKWFICCTLMFWCGKRQGEDTQACDWSLEPTHPWIVNIPQLIIQIGFLSYSSYQPLVVNYPAAGN